MRSIAGSSARHRLLASTVGVAVQTILDAVDPYGFRWGSITGPLRAVAENGFSAFFLLGGVLLVAWFPDGRTTSRLGTMAQAVLLVLLVSQFLRLLDPRVLGESALAFVLIIVAYATALTDLVVRYRRSDGVRRTQIRWVLASGAVTASLIVAPLRRSVQASLDQRFNRAQGDAAAVIGQFAGRLRDELDLATLTGDLRATVLRAVQSDSAAVWLRTRGGT